MNNNHSHTWGQWNYSEEYHAPVRYCQDCGAGQSALSWQKVKTQKVGFISNSKSSESEILIRKLIASAKEAQTTGKISSDLQDEIVALTNNPEHQKFLFEKPQYGNELEKQLIEMGAMDTESPVINSADYYRAGEGKYELRWELSPMVTLPIPFSELDRETQFSILFTEWSRREFEGMGMCLAGNPDNAEEFFFECVERAKQIDVAELEARSYEGLMRVAQMRGNREDEEKWNRSAQEARARQS